MAVADVDEARAHEMADRFGFEHAFSDYRRVLDRPDVPLQQAAPELAEDRVIEARIV